MAAQAMSGILDPHSPFGDRFGKVAGDTGSGQEHRRNAEKKPVEIGQKYRGKKQGRSHPDDDPADRPFPCLVRTYGGAELGLAEGPPDIIGPGIGAGGNCGQTMSQLPPSGKNRRPRICAPRTPR